MGAAVMSMDRAEGNHNHANFTQLASTLALYLQERAPPDPLSCIHPRPHRPLSPSSQPFKDDEADTDPAAKSAVGASDHKSNKKADDVTEANEERKSNSDQSNGAQAGRLMLGFLKLFGTKSDQFRNQTTLSTNNPGVFREMEIAVCTRRIFHEAYRTLAAATGPSQSGGGGGEHRGGSHWSGGGVRGGLLMNTVFAPAAVIEVRGAGRIPSVYLKESLVKVFFHLSTIHLSHHIGMLTILKHNRRLL
jgi:hypothetical protein